VRAGLPTTHAESGEVGPRTGHREAAGRRVRGVYPTRSPSRASGSSDGPQGGSGKEGEGGLPTRRLVGFGGSVLVGGIVRRVNCHGRDLRAETRER
jgi:hypothetical protein